jgi:hypothetical protein
MIQYLFSGFELSLYSVYEYHYIFWYVSMMAVIIQRETSLATACELEIDISRLWSVVNLSPFLVLIVSLWEGGSFLRLRNIYTK